jgi:hypothetical protein
MYNVRVISCENDVRRTVKSLPGTWYLGFVSLTRNRSVRRLLFLASKEFCLPHIGLANGNMSSENNENTHELTAIRINMEDDDDKYITVSAPTNLPGGYEMNVDSEGSHWTNSRS